MNPEKDKQSSAATGFRDYCDQVADHFLALRAVEPDVRAAVDMVEAALLNGSKILVCGNGGSAADAQHIAAELMGRFLRDRQPLPAVALTVDTSALTAIANDYGYEFVFARQLQGLGVRNDVLLAISTSGRSENVRAALRLAGEMGIKTIGMTGAVANGMDSLCDVCISVPASLTNHVQEMHIAVAHFICEEVERKI